ncbi:hypothetical protein ACH4SP_07005 [Streptomyces sp. NPDC021093]|uniref:hypothetical protein n=1 Tax=Streptomyces sp. NPDC021093 TaxID=3365112 RepID=UPI0037A5A1FB
MLYAAVDDVVYVSAPTHPFGRQLFQQSAQLGGCCRIVVQGAAQPRAPDALKVGRSSWDVDIGSVLLQFALDDLLLAWPATCEEGRDASARAQPSVAICWTRVVAPAAAKAANSGST